MVFPASICFKCSDSLYGLKKIKILVFLQQMSSFSSTTSINIKVHFQEISSNVEAGPWKKKEVHIS